jgi:hypothetical protein
MLLDSRVMKALGGNACAISHFCTHYLRDNVDNFETNSEFMYEMANKSRQHASSHVSYDGIDDSDHSDMAADSANIRRRTSRNSSDLLEGLRLEEYADIMSKNIRVADADAEAVAVPIPVAVACSDEDWDNTTNVDRRQGRLNSSDKDSSELELSAAVSVATIVSASVALPPLSATTLQQPTVIPLSAPDSQQTPSPAMSEVSGVTVVAISGATTPEIANQDVDPYNPGRPLQDTDDDMYAFVHQQFNPAQKSAHQLLVNQNIPFKIVYDVMASVLRENGFQRELTEHDAQFLFTLCRRPEGRTCPNCTDTPQSICPQGCRLLSNWWRSLLSLLPYMKREFESSGLLHGFLTREQSEEMLKSSSILVSTFIIRFSERNLGSLSISFKASANIVHHLTVTIDKSGHFTVRGNPTVFMTLTGAVLSAGAGDCQLLYPGTDKKLKFS